jgi:hypothetical protein
MVLMGINTLLGNFNRLLTCKRKDPQIEEEKIANQQHYEDKNPKNLFSKILKSREVIKF